MNTSDILFSIFILISFIVVYVMSMMETRRKKLKKIGKHTNAILV